MAPRKTQRFPERIRTPDIFEPKVAEAAIRSGLLPAGHNQSGPLPLLGDEWPSQTTRVFPETGDR